MGRGFPGKLIRLSAILLWLPLTVGCAITEASTWQFPWEKRASYAEDFVVPPKTDTRYVNFPRTPPIDRDTYLKKNRRGLLDDLIMPASGPTRPQTNQPSMGD